MIDEYTNSQLTVGSLDLVLAASKELIFSKATSFKTTFSVPTASTYSWYTCRPHLTRSSFLVLPIHEAVHLSMNAKSSTRPRICERTSEAISRHDGDSSVTETLARAIKNDEATSDSSSFPAFLTIR